MNAIIRFESTISTELKAFIRSIGEEDMILNNVQHMYFNQIVTLNRFLNECKKYDDITLIIEPGETYFTIIINTK